MSETTIQQLPIDNLAEFKGHPFKPYEGKRFDDMVESVKANGVITPIIVRKKDKGYEILSGHNRTRAAKEAGLTEVPSIVREDVDDEQARLIVTLTNLQQRGFGELTHSERANVIKLTYDSLKRQGQRNDLIDEVDALVGGQKLLSDIRKKMSARDALAEQFGLTGNNIAYYLRLNKLIKQLLDLLDEGEIDLSVAEKLTYLSKDDQKTTCKVSNAENKKITIGKAKALVNAAKKGPLTEETVREILAYRQARKSSYRLNADVFERYFTDAEPEAIDGIIAQALEMWKALQG